MQVCLIEHIGEFEALRASWDAVFASDKYASVFMSWAWLRGWLGVSPYPWCVLGVRQNASSPWVGFFPISIRGRRFRLDEPREIHMAGDPAADYTGFLCAPEYQHEVFRAWADFIVDRLRWDRMRLREINDPRIDLFLESLPLRDTEILRHSGQCCPYIPLPETWDQYLSECLGYETRKSLRKKLRLVERDCRVTQLNHDNTTQQIDALLTLAGMSSYHAGGGTIEQFRAVFASCAAANLAAITIVWRDEAPIAGIGSFIDSKAQSLDFYLTSFDERFAEYSPGRVVNALAIRYAIEQKLRVLDFLRGDEPYKFQFGAQRRYTCNVTVLRRGFAPAARRAAVNIRRKLGI